MLIQLSNVYYLPKLNINLISFSIFEGKKCEFQAVNSFLQINNRDINIVLKLIRENSIYLLLQPKPQN